MYDVLPSSVNLHKLDRKITQSVICLIIEKPYYISEAIALRYRRHRTKYCVRSNLFELAIRNNKCQLERAINFVKEGAKEDPEAIIELLNQSV